MIIIICFSIDNKNNYSFNNYNYYDYSNYNNINNIHRAGHHQNARLVVNFQNNTARLKATKNIRNGEEIFVSYGHQYHINETGVQYRTKGVELV